MVGRVFDSERWLEAEKRVGELVAGIQPDEESRRRRKDLADYVQSIIGKCFSCQVFIFGSVPLMTYLPDGDIDLTVFSDDENLKGTWADKVYQVMKAEKKNENAEFHVKEVQLISAEVKVIKCLIEGVVVDISFYQTGGIHTLCFLEEMDDLINQDHLFKRSIILIKAWCYYESRILGSHHGLISTYALETMIICIFHVFDNSFAGPLEVLYHFLDFFSNLDWESYCVSIWGPVSIQLLPNISVIPPRKDNGEFHHKKNFLKIRSLLIDNLACGPHCQRRTFVSKYFNIVDPLCAHNNLGRSVYKGNFFRILSAFVFGAKKLARLLDFPKEEMISELNLFFMNTWERHRASVENLKPYKSIQLGASYTVRNISYKGHNDNISEDHDHEHVADVALSFYGVSSQILRMINQKSEDISRPNGIRMADCNAKNEEDYMSHIIIKNKDYVENAVDSAKSVRTKMNYENLSYINSTNMEEGDCSPKTCFRSHPSNISEVSFEQNDDMIQNSDSHDVFHVISEHDCSSKSSQAVTSIDDSSCSKKNSSLQSTDSNGASQSFHDSTSSIIKTSLSKLNSQYSYNDYPAHEIYVVPPNVGNYEVPINETARINDADHNIIANYVELSSTLYPTGPPVPFLEMLQTYNFPSHISYNDGLCGLLDVERLNFDQNADSSGMFDQPEIHAKTILSHGLRRPNIPLLGPSPYPYPTVAPNVYFRGYFPPPLAGPIRPILPQGSQFVPPIHVLPNMLTFGDGFPEHPGGIRTYPLKPIDGPKE